MPTLQSDLSTANPVEQECKFHLTLIEIPGARELQDWFGYWPSFHDAEIIELALNRAAPASLKVHTWEMTKDVDEKGYYVTAKHVIVELTFEAISGLALTGFNHQNVIFGMEIEKIDSGFRVNLDECYGLAGTIEAGKISINLAHTDWLSAGQQ
jgi:Immunity protein 50